MALFGRESYKKSRKIMGRDALDDKYLRRIGETGTKSKRPRGRGSR